MKNQLLELVNLIPFGKVCSYGSLAVQLDSHYDIQTSGRLVGKILSSMPQSEWDTCPWWRVINKNGYISSLKLGYKGIIQKQLLEQEGVYVKDGYIDMKKYAYEFVV